MARRKRLFQKQTVAKAGYADHVAKIESSLTHNRSQKALSLLKNALKNKVPLDSVLIGRVYLRRLKDLLAEGKINNAQQLYKQQLLNTAYWHEQVELADQYMLHFEMGLYEAWTVYGQNAEKDALINQIILTKIKDFRPFIETMGFAADHPLKIQATFILDAWTLIDIGDYEKAGTVLNNIGRRSGFRAWRLLLQALIAYYRSDRKTFDQNLSRMPENAAVQPLIDRLQHLENQEKSLNVEQSPVLMFTAKESCRYDLIAVENLLTAGKNKTAISKINTINKKLIAEKKPQLASEISSMVNANFERIPSQRYFAELRKGKRKSDIDEERCALESVFHDITTKQADPQLDAIDYAVLLTTIGQAWYKIYTMGDVEYVVCGDDDTWVAGKILDIEHACVGCLIKQMRNICEQASSYYPLEKTYELHVKMLVLDPKLRGLVPLLHGWMQDFPDSITALERSFELFIKLKSWSAAALTLKRLKERTGNSQAFQDNVFDLASYQAILLCNASENVFTRVHQLLEPVWDQTGWKQVLLHTIMWLSCGSQRKMKQQQGELLAQCGAPYLTFYFCYTFNAKFRKQRLPKPVQNQLANGSETMLKDLQTIISLPAFNWSNDTHFNVFLPLIVPVKVLRNIEASPKLYYRFLMLYLRQREEAFQMPKDAYTITAKYLSAKTEHVAEFWAIRGLLYHHEYKESGHWRRPPDIVYECLMIAYHYGLQDGIITNKYKEMGFQLNGIKEDSSVLTIKKVSQFTAQERKRTCVKDLRAVAKVYSSNVNNTKFMMFCESFGIPLDKDITEDQHQKMDRIMSAFYDQDIAKLPIDFLCSIVDIMEDASNNQDFIPTDLLKAIIDYVLKEDDDDEIW